jgi:hypothetical protein
MNKGKTIEKKMRRRNVLGYDEEGVLMEYLTKREKATICGFIIGGATMLVTFILIAVFL